MTKQQEIYVLWDERDGYRYHKFYLDKESANIALEENYTEYWIDSKKAKVETILAVSYFAKENTSRSKEVSGSCFK